MSDQSYDNIPSNPPSHASSSPDDLDSLPSTSASTTSMSPSEEYYQNEAEREWRESLQQLELVLTMVLIPYVGKYFGRKAAYWGMHPSILDSLDPSQLSWIRVAYHLYRLGEVHGVEVPRLHRNHKFKTVQGRRRRRSRC